MGIITGRVVAEDGRALVSVLVDVENRDLEGVTTDSLGEFKLDMLAPGELAVRARLIGRGTYRRHLEVNAGDSLHIVIVLAPALVRIDGADRLLSSADVRAEAERLLPELLEHPDVQALIRDAFAAQSGAVVAWVPWARSSGVRIVDGVAPVHLIRDCEGCSADTSWTVEGGRQYRAGSPHLRVGVTPMRVDESVISFCVAAPAVGAVLMQNCGSGGRALQVTYERQVSGVWTRLNRKPGP